MLRDASGEVLVAQRPHGKIAAGKWEFPGGKIEPGESALQALSRELHEELGVDVRKARPLIRFRHEYLDRIVVLDTWLVEQFDGIPVPREAQRFAWIRPEAIHTLDNLPTVGPIVRALRLPAHYVFTPPNVNEALILRGLPQLPEACLLRLRVPVLDDEAYGELAARLLPQVRAAGRSLILDRDPRQAVDLGADGWHASGRVLQQKKVRPVPAGLWFGASVHDAAGLETALDHGADFAVLSPVLATATHPQAQAIGWDRFGQMIAEYPRPVFALGGLGPAQIGVAQSHRAQGVAGISAYW